MALTTTWGVTYTTLFAERLSSIKSPITAAGTAAVNTAAGLVSQALQKHGIEPDSITDAAYPVDYQRMHDLVSDIATVEYYANTAGVIPQSASIIANRSRDDLNILRNCPTDMLIYSTPNGATNVMSHAAYADQEAVDRLVESWDSPIDSPLQWGTM